MDIKHLVVGLQGAGKTTFAAALWHLIEAREVPTTLAKGRHTGDYSYLEEISGYWANGWEIPRTDTDRVEVIKINLIDPNDTKAAALEFTDLSGETFERAFATRDISGALPGLLDGMEGLLLFVSAIRHNDDTSLVDIAIAAPDLFSEDDADTPTSEDWPEIHPEFDPAKAPDQVKLVDLLDAWQEQPIERRPKRIAIIVSAWDLIAGASPGQWLETRMPLLAQYLSNLATVVPFRVYGVSAQGGSLPQKEKPTEPSDRDTLMKFARASERITIVGNGAGSHDLTDPIHWLGSSD